MKNIALVAAMGALALAQPAMAQDESATEEATEDTQAEPQQADPDEAGQSAGVALAELMGAIFSAEPLTAEQEARLPEAGAAANALVPEGIYGRMMREMMDGTVGGLFGMILEQGDAMSSLDLADYTGLYGEEVDALTEDQRRELTTIFDPVYQERMEAEMTAMTDMMERVFGSLEPGLREGLSRALATRFSTDELDAINAFFATPAGAKYAGESLIMFTDPQIMASVGQAMPALMQEMPALFGGEGDTAGDLPSPRRYDDLTPSEQRRAAELLGVDQPTLRARMAEAEEAKAEEAAAEGGAPADDAWSDDDQAIPDVETEETSDAFEEAMEEVGA